VTKSEKKAGGGELALILSAERLFAERGIAGVSLREINQAANQRNISAAHYHFGSREGLVDAVLRYRLPDLDRARGALLLVEAPSKNLRFYLEAFVRPLVAQLTPRIEGNYFVRFMQQYERARGGYEIFGELAPESVRIYAGIEKLIYYLPEPVRSVRIRYMINMIHAVLATAEERMVSGEVDFSEIPLTASNMIDMFVSAMAAPLSAQTIALLPDASGMD
jgi:AcrR family transcriptional regulator